MDNRNVNIAIAGIICFVSYFYNNYWNDPFRNGKIPAMQRLSEEHELYFISDDLSFVRTMSDPLTINWFRRLMQILFQEDDTTTGFNKMTEEGKELITELETEKAFERSVDYGGYDGHVAERINWDDIESIKTTRCATTRSALTAYYCGRTVAKNNDVALGRRNVKGVTFGTASFTDHVNFYQHHNEGDEGKGGRDYIDSDDGRHRYYHRRSVYRLGIGCTKGCVGFEHAFTIVAQPDGTFLWLQSFIGMYSLSTWMKKKDSTKESELAYRLTFNELMEKLDMLDRLMAISNSEWSFESNTYYNYLFNVNQSEEALRNDRARPWNPDHPLDSFTWDEACQYPLPSKILGEDDKHSTDDDDDDNDGYLITN